MGNQLQDLLQQILSFRQNRDWKQFHTPKNLAVSICIEAGELLENFQWKKDDERVTSDQRAKAAQELADVLIYSLLLAHALGIDLAESAREKIRDNAGKYPVEKARGNAKKYTEL